VARADLASYLGLDPTEPIELLEMEAFEQVDWDLTEATRRAEEEHPEILASEAGARSGRSGVRVAKSRLLPSVDLYYSARYFNTEFGDFTEDERVKWNYGARMTFTLFDGLSRWANIRRAEATAVESRRAVDDKRREVALAVRRSWLDLEVARRSIEVAGDAVRSSEEDLRLAQERFKIGEGTVLDVIDAQVNLTRARTDRVTAVHDARLAASALRNAIGITNLPEPAE
jgi:outer membrane protein TolC